MADEKLIEIGRIVGVHGLGGWLKVQSFAEPPAALMEYSPLRIAGQWLSELELKPHGRGLMLRIAGHQDRTAAEPLVGELIEVKRSQLAALADNEFYHADLEGLEVVSTTGEALGCVERVMPTGANDVLVVRGNAQHLIPFTPGHTVVEVDLNAQRIVVDWEADWL